MAENDIQEKEKNLENTKKVIAEFKRRISIYIQIARRGRKKRFR